jgi:bifunctional DNase/RNase
MDKILLNITAIATSEIQTNSFVIILKEEEGNRQLPIVIGAFEAQAIAIAIENIPHNRPLTHDLFRDFMVKMGARLTEIVISDILDGVFYATVYVETADGQSFSIDSRTSDAIAMAVRFQSPIFAVPKVLDEAGIVFDSMSETPTPKPPPAKKLSNLSKKQLKKMLDKALENEEYEKAAKIRDELKKRTEG